VRRRRAARVSPFLRRQLLIALAVAAALLLAFETTNLDTAFSALFYDPVSRAFPGRYDWFLEVVMHRWAKNLLWTFGLLCLAGWLLSLAVDRLRPLRRRLLFLTLALGLGPATVAGLKVATDKHCPWDLEIYGGNLPHVRLLEPRPEGLPPGRCFPAGHAAGGFALISLWFVWRRERPLAAAAALGIGFAGGLALGFGRIMQGAHFLSHNLWAAWVCWVVALLLHALILEGEAPPAQGAPAH
jgi:membrane-associated PAP2 superfamily phosphatase